MTPDSLDLREKIVANYEAGNTSIRKVAKQFQVATKTVQTLLNQYRETGELNHKTLGSPIKSPPRSPSRENPRNCDRASRLDTMAVL